MSLEAMQVIYPQTPIEDERDVDLLWGEQMELMQLTKEDWIYEIGQVNALERRKDKLVLIEKLSMEKNIPLQNFIRPLDTYNFLSGETIFYELYPDYFNYMVLGKDFLARQSKIRKFSFFTDFQVDYQRSFLDPSIYRMGVTANRGGAKSWLMTDCSIIDCTIHPGMEIAILGGSEKQSKGAYEYSRAMAEDETCGIHHLIEKPVTREKIQFKPRLLDGTVVESGGYVSKIFNLATAETSVRGPRASKVVFDEVTRIPPDIIDSTLGQAITSPSIKIVWGGTPDDPGHTAHTEWWINKPDNVTLKDGTVKKCHHWINYYEPFPRISWHLFHWDAYDCHVDNGGWITEEAIQVLLATYRSFSKRRREIYGKWTSSEGNILKMEDIEASSKNFDMHSLPSDFGLYDGIIVAVDGARHRHYSTIVVVGFKNFQAYVLYAKGWDNIKEPDLRDKIFTVIGILRDGGSRNLFVIIEDAPVSTTLIDNVREQCKKYHIRFDVSTFKHNKLKFVDRVTEYFETGMIKIPASLSQLLDELYIWRWAKNIDNRGRRLPEKGNDDFIDALMHALFSDMVVFYAAGLMKKGRRGGKFGKQYAGAERPEKKLSRSLQVIKRRGFVHKKRFKGL